MASKTGEIRGSDFQRARALEAYARYTDLPLTILAALIVPLIVLPLLMEFDPPIDAAFLATDWTIWAVFAFDLALRTALAPRRGRYLITHWFDVIIVVVPFLRPLRVMRSARALRALRALRAGAYIVRVTATVREIGQRHGLVYVVAVAAMLLVASAALVFALERRADGTIDDFPTALWWAMTTITTVGYGDTYPVTAEGRGVAVFLMIVGISLFGFLTANIAAFLVSLDKPQSDVSLRDIASKLDSVERELASLRRQLAENPRLSGDTAS